MHQLDGTPSIVSNHVHRSIPRASKLHLENRRSYLIIINQFTMEHSLHTYKIRQVKENDLAALEQAKRSARVLEINSDEEFARKNKEYQ